jgi:TonB family protein
MSERTDGSGKSGNPSGFEIAISEENLAALIGDKALREQEATPTSSEDRGPDQRRLPENLPESSVAAHTEPTGVDRDPRRPEDNVASVLSLVSRADDQRVAQPEESDPTEEARGVSPVNLTVPVADTARFAGSTAHPETVPPSAEKEDSEPRVPGSEAPPVDVSIAREAAGPAAPSDAGLLLPSPVSPKQPLAPSEPLITKPISETGTHASSLPLPSKAAPSIKVVSPPLAQQMTGVRAPVAPSPSGPQVTAKIRVTEPPNKISLAKPPSSSLKPTLRAGEKFEITQRTLGQEWRTKATSTQAVSTEAKAEPNVSEANAPETSPLETNSLEGNSSKPFGAEAVSTAPALAAPASTSPVSFATPASSAMPGATRDAFTFDANATPQNSNRLKWALMSAGALIVIGGAVWYFLASSRAPAANTTASTATAATQPFTLQLQAEQVNGAVTLHWNPQSQMINDAKEGRLVIAENNQPPRNLALDLSQLKIGYFSYQQLTDKTQFRLEISDRSGFVTEESVMVTRDATANAEAGNRTGAIAAAGISTSPNPGTPGGTVGEMPSGTAGGPQNSGVSPGAPIAPAANAESTRQPARPAPRAFEPPPVARTGSVPELIPEPSVQISSGPSLPAGVNVPFNLSMAVPAGVTPPKQVRVGGGVQAANLIKNVKPVYPPVARSTRVQGVVRFSALIGKDGKVRNLQVLSGPPLLVQSATDAVRQWVYRPTLLNGEPVEVVTQIDVNFTLN